MNTSDETKPEITISGHENIPQALGLLKDWVTTLVGFATLAIGVVAGFLEINDGIRLFPTQMVLLIICLISLVAALVCAGFLLFVLPGAVQRKHRDPHQDIYSLKTYGRLTIGFWAGALWGCFLFAISIFTLFVLHRIIYRAPQAAAAQQVTTAMRSSSGCTATVQSLIVGVWRRPDRVLPTSDTCDSPVTQDNA